MESKTGVTFYAHKKHNSMSKYCTIKGWEMTLQSNGHMKLDGIDILIYEKWTSY